MTEWLDDNGRRQQRDHNTERAAESHAVRLTHTGIRRVVVFEMDDQYDINRGDK